MFCRFPLDLNTWLGYSIAYAIESAAAYAAYLSAIPVMSLIVGSSWILTSIGKEITNNLHELNMNTDSRASERKQNGFLLHFCNISISYSNAKQLSKISL